MKNFVKDALTEKDNETFCAMRIIGFLGVALVGTAIVVGAAPLEVGAGIATIITSIGGGIRLKNEGVDTAK
jgi:hypothetical protein